MGKRGPRPTPTAILKLRGSRRAGGRKGEPRPERRRPACPRWLDQAAKACWKQIVPQLEAMGVLTRIDANAVVRYCVLWSRWLQAEQFIAKHGAVYPLKDNSGRIRCLQQFPQVAIAHRLSIALSKIEAEFGMTPSSRSRIEVDPSLLRSSAEVETYLTEGKGRFFARLDRM